MEVELRIQNEKARTRTLRLTEDAMIGRGSDCQLRIASTAVSRRHCIVRVSSAGVTVRDLGSSNGTFLDGQRLAPETDVAVKPGSSLQVGPLRCTLEFALPDDETIRTSQSQASESTILIPDAWPSPSTLPAAPSAPETGTETTFDPRLADRLPPQTQPAHRSVSPTAHDDTLSSFELPAVDESAVELPAADHFPQTQSPPSASDDESAPRRKSLFQMLQPGDQSAPPVLPGVSSRPAPPAPPAPPGAPAKSAEEDDDPALRDFLNQFEP